MCDRFIVDQVVQRKLALRDCMHGSGQSIAGTGLCPRKQERKEHFTCVRKHRQWRNQYASSSLAQTAMCAPVLFMHQNSKEGTSTSELYFAYEHLHAYRTVTVRLNLTGKVPQAITLYFVYF